MEVKDKLFSWFIKNILIPRNEIIDKPGFIILRISDKTNTINLREILISENIFSEIEKKIVKEYGDVGENILYSIGKKFGYNFAFVSQYPKADKEKDFSKFAYFMSRYLESIYASKVEEYVDFKNKQFIFKAKNWIVCNKNGLGYILFVGAGTGMISYAFNDPSIEGVQVKCEGRGDDHCELICAPETYFKKQGIEFFTERNLKNTINISEYNSINDIRDVKYTSNSFKKLIDSEFFKYKEGTINWRNERFALTEASIIYFLEKELKKLKNGLKILWSVSFDFGKKLAKISKADDPCKFIMEFFPALGFGDIMATKSGEKYEIFVNYFPWLKWADEIDFTMFRGILSGVISGSMNKKVELKKMEKDISMGYLSLHISN